MSDSPAPAVTWEPITESIWKIVLQSPPANALGPRIVEGLHAALDAADAAGGVKVVLVTSALEGLFAAGADIKHMSSIDAASFTAYGDELRGSLDRIAGAERITIAVVEGLALGGGLELAMACTLRVAGDRASFGLPEVKLGLIPGAGGTQRLPRLVGRGRALDIMLTGRQVPAQEAHAIGLVDRLAEHGQAEAVARELADQLRRSSFPAQQAVVRTVDASFDLSLEDGLLFEVAQEQALFEDGEAAEGIGAFLGKRSPDFA
ncbi:MAG: echA [Marmoricola sp.]|nr:echA [Marmoricola sp.]